MVYVLSALFAALLVFAQVCWKFAVSKQDIFHDITFVKLFGFVFSPLVLAGIVIYIIATGLYMFLISRYQFSTVQSFAIPLSLIFSITLAIYLFSEKLYLVNFIGIILVVLGLVLITYR